MRVNQASDHITHAVVGGQEAISLEISQSAEFFQILSSTLYSDKQLAVIREVLCNAWDAHIEAGITDKPVKVTLTCEKLIIQDFGPGIHRDNIGPIYGTYGASTKVSNANVTGGFGLGCKAPFAYTDHFEVTSCHQHVKTIYQMALSSAQVEGKPSILPILSIPTTESGITVSIDLKSSDDRHRFEELINTIACLGEMKVNFNGDEITTIPFSTAQHSFMMVKRNLVPQRPLIAVRCGNVVYPIAESSEYSSEQSRAQEFLENLSDSYYGRNSDWCIVLMAPPGAVSITPSRESLSLTTNTITTIKSLLTKFLDTVEIDLAPQALEISREKMTTLWSNQRQYALFDSNPYWAKGMYALPKSESLFLSTRREIAQTALSYSMPRAKSYVRDELKVRLSLLIESNTGDTNLLKSLRREMDTIDDWKTWTWFPRRIVWPMVRDLAVADFPGKHLYIYHGDAYGGKMSEMFTLASEYKVRQPANALPFLKKFIVLAHSRSHVRDRAPTYSVWRNVLQKGKSTPCFCYIVGRKREQIDAAKAVFEKLGYYVLDITQVQSWEEERFQTAYVPEERAPSKPRPKGYPLLRAYKFKGGNFDFTPAPSTIEDRSETVETVFKMGRKECNQLYWKIDETASKMIHQYFGDKVGIVANQVALDKAHDAGIMPFDKWVRNILVQEFKINTAIKTMWTNDPASFDKHYRYGRAELYKTLREDPILRKHFNLAAPPGVEELAFLTLWDTFGSYEQERDIDLKPIYKEMHGWKASKELLAFEASYEKSKLISLFSSSEVGSILKHTTDEKVKTAAREMIIAAFKG